MALIRPKDEPRVSVRTAGDTLMLDGATTRSILADDLLRQIPDTTVTGTVTITPTPATFNKGIDVEQTSPVGGSNAGPISFNTFNVVDQGGYTITAPGTDTDDYGLSTTNVVGLRVNFSSAGGPIRGAMIASYRATTNLPGSYYGFAGSIYTNLAGANPLLWGSLGIAQVGPAGTASLIVGLEGEVGVYGAGTVNQRIAVAANTQGPNAALTDLDAAFAVTAGGGTAGFAPFKKMFAVSSVLYGGVPLAANADIFWYQPDPTFHPTLTVANVFNCPNWNVTVNFADFPNFGISGSGVAAFGIPVTGIIGSPYGLVVSGTSKGAVAVGVSTNTATGSSFVEVRNSAVSSQANFIAHEAARTTVRYGVLLGNYNELSAFAGNGLIIGTNNNAPLLLGANNVTRMQIGAGATGPVNVGPNVAATANFTINANTVSPSNGGASTVFQISGADGTTPLGLIDSYGTGTFGALSFRAARGLSSAFTASKNGDGLGQIGFTGAAANNTFVNTTGGNGGAIIAASATEDWSATNQGSQLKFFTTRKTTAAIALSMILQDTGDLSLPIGGIIPASFTVAALPAGVTGKTVFCSNVRVLNVGGTLEGAGAGTGGLVCYNGTAWKVVGTNITAVA